MKKNIISLILAGLGLVLLYFITLPSINLHSVGFVIYLALILGYLTALVLFCFRKKWIEIAKKKGKFTYTSFSIDKNGRTNKKVKEISEKFSLSRSMATGFSWCLGVALVMSLVVGLFGTKLFSAKAFAKQLTIGELTDEEFNEQFNFDDDHIQLPIIDKDIAFKYAQAKLSTYGAQYTIDIENFTIISVTRNGQDELIRVTPLEYSGLFVSMNRYNQGTIGYIEVNVVTKETKLVEVAGGMKYMPSSILFNNLDFHIHMNYPTALYEDKYFEIDDTGKPYWVIPIHTKEIALFTGKMPTGVLLCDPVTGKMQKYAIGEEPEWVDRVVLDTIMETQANNALKYGNGFFNATFGQKKEVFQLSDGYNYFIKDGHTYLVSCITSPNENDQTSIGFITIDLKTKVAKKYYIPGITEMRAREIAMQHEEVKAQQLTATWPILVDFKDVPTYFLVLKNDVQVRKIVLVNVSDGTHIAMGSTVEEASQAYAKILNESGDIKEEEKEVTGKVIAIEKVNNIRYFKLDTIPDTFFKLDIEKIETDTAIFLSIMDEVKVTYSEGEKYYQVINIDKSSVE